MNSFASVIDAFGGPAKFGEAIGIPGSHARAMKTRDSIPADRWSKVVAAAGSRGIPNVTFEKLAELAARAPVMVRA